MRIAPSKIDAFTGALKLLKAGDIVTSHELKGYLLHAAKAISLVPESALTDVKRLTAFKNAIEKQGSFKINVDTIDLPNFINKIENAINERKEGYEAELKKQFEAVSEGSVTFVNTST